MSLLRQLWGFYAACASTRNERNALGNPKGVQRIATAAEDGFTRTIYWTHRYCTVQRLGSAELWIIAAQRGFQQLDSAESRVIAGQRGFIRNVFLNLPICKILRIWQAPIHLSLIPVTRIPSLCGESFHNDVLHFF